MKLHAALFRFGIKSITNRRVHTNPARIAMLVFAFFVMVFAVSAQTVRWSDSFVGGQQPTTAQCENWTTFINQLSGKNFASVKLSGTFDEQGKSITDPVAATQLASLLSSKTPGVVNIGSDYWVVTLCGSGACNTPSVTLSYKGNKAECDCLDNYTLRPHAAGPNWGGVNSQSCSGPSQTMKLEFNSGVSIMASGPTSFCEGGSVELTANIEICSSPYSYLWSNGATTQTITISEAGNYWVRVTGADEVCTGISETVTITIDEVAVNAGLDVTTCKDPVQLTATGSSAGATLVSKFCLFDAGGGDCNFTDDLCSDGYEFVVDKAFSQDVTITNPDQLIFHLYYSPASTNTTFSLKVNGQQIGSFLETNDTGTCTPGSFGQYPKTFTFAQSEFIQYWKEGTTNNLTIEIDSDESGVYFAGAIVEVSSSNEIYSWSPVDGLSDPSVKDPFANPAVSTTYTVTYIDPHGCKATDQVEVIVHCITAPVAVCNEVTVPLDGKCEAIVDAAQFDGGSTSPSGTELTFSVSPSGPYTVTTDVILTVKDADGTSSTCNTRVIVTDTTNPTIITPADTIVANDPGLCAAAITLKEPETGDNCGVASVVHDQPDNIFAVGETIVTWTVTDNSGNQQTAMQTVIVTNLTPVINSVKVSTPAAAVNSPVVLTTTYTDDNVSKATIDWGDYSGIQTVIEPPTIFEVSHSYSASGSYSATITLIDACANSTYFYKSILVVNKHRASVGGGGWFDSPPGANVRNPRATGKANFAFEAAYVTASEVPVGHSAFTFKAGDVKFRGSQYKSLIVDGATARVKGSGTMNGSPGYEILIAAVDETKPDDKTDLKLPSSKKQDRIRVKIWDPSGSVIYDTQPGAADEAIATTALGGGSISIEYQKTSLSHTYKSPVASSFGEGSTSVYPNPFTNLVDVKFNSVSRENIVVQVLDLTGKIIFNEVFPASVDGSYSLEIFDADGPPGIYIMTIKQGKRVELLRLVRN